MIHQFAVCWTMLDPTPADWTSMSQIYSGQIPQFILCIKTLKKSHFVDGEIPARGLSLDLIQMNHPHFSSVSLGFCRLWSRIKPVDGWLLKGQKAFGFVWNQIDRFNGNTDAT